VKIEKLAAVAPHAGAWIETFIRINLKAHVLSRLTRARGLKPCAALLKKLSVEVAPHAGAWIETKPRGNSIARAFGRASRGRVD